ncbi:MAG TPA: DUF2325 domain-containing protein [Dongiaceae bacterium]|nr:DUF2325 domain-containing protein [Dongiaceae bacterium]
MGFERPHNVLGATGPAQGSAPGLSRKAVLGIGVVPKAGLDLAAPALREVELRRTVRLSDLSANLHCSIVGTCLTTAELRQFAAKLGIADAKNLSEHDLHKYGVTIAGQRDQGSKLLHKLLDRKHRAILNRFVKAKTDAEIGALWDEAAKRGDIPGAYWAVMSHPLATEALIKRVFGQVHMLSHLVGAANRADIRRLADLESENAALREKARRQQERIRDAVLSRDGRIRELEALLARTLSEQARPVAGGDRAPEADAMTTLVAGLERRLSSEATHGRRIEERLKASEERLAAERAARMAAEERAQAVGRDLAAAEAMLNAAGDGAAAQGTALAGQTILYVGGQTGHIAGLKQAAGRFAAELIHHDGGIEDRNPQLAGLMSQASIVFFPVDCISHDAMQTVKRLSRQASKPYVPLRSAGLGSFLAALQAVSKPMPGAQPTPAF